MGIGKWFDMTNMTREEVMRGFDVLLQYGRLARGMTKEKYLYYKDETPIIFVDRSYGVIYRTSPEDSMVCAFRDVNDITNDVMKASYKTPATGRDDVYTKDQFFEDIRTALSKAAKHGFMVRSIDTEFLDIGTVSGSRKYQVLDINYNITES